jgi:5-methyltetrahydrofolate--homocysteine methyltransferase
MPETLLEAIKRRPLLGDGAMGTQLQLAGLESGGCGELWNLTHPERVEAIQRSYAEAGSDVLITNTFGGSRIMLTRHGCGEQTVAINRAAAECARRAFGDRPGFVIGDIGPFGGILEPLGDMPEATVREAFFEQAAALVSAGVDAIIVETQTSFEEMAIGIAAAKEAGAPCIIASFAFDVTRDGEEIRTMMGIDLEAAGTFVAEQGADIVALNCGTGIDMNWAARATRRYAAVCDLPVMAQPNAGQPVLENMKVVYKQPPEEMAAGVPDLYAAGASIIGACCGSTPAHIALMRKALDEQIAAR